MIHVLESVLDATTLARLRALAESLEFVDGRLTNRDSSVKRNEQISQSDQRALEAGVLVRDALVQHPRLAALGWPRQIARPTLVRYRPGMTYGWHVDAALFPSQPPMRSDLSCSVFISPPDAYEGGALEFEWGQDRRGFRLAAGDAILYPSTTIHRVAPVTQGTRLVAITWLQSYVADAQRRELLNQIDELRGMNLDDADAGPELASERRERRRVLLESLSTNLFRMWADT